MNSRLSYPEIELTAVNRSRTEEKVSSGNKPPAKFVDLLEIGRSPEEKGFWKEGLDHESLLEHFNVQATSDRVATPVLRIFFTSAPTPRALDPLTVLWMRNHFAVSPIFLDFIDEGICELGTSSFLKWDDQGHIVTIAGFYQLSAPEFSGRRIIRMINVWFSHDLRNGSSTYILDNCQSSAKRLILDYASGENADTLGRLCAIDAVIAECCGQAWREQTNLMQQELTKYEYLNFNSPHLSPEDKSEAVERLHHISQNLHVTVDSLVDLDECLEFLRDIHRQYVECSPGFRRQNSAAESLQYLVSRTRLEKRWAVNFIARTDIRINLFFNLASQNDNRTNLDIASFTSKIAVDTQRDSSSMITIAAVTMFFLPGTFVSAIFSMSFFNSGTDSSGQVAISVSPQWWYFVAITIPLTIIVFLVWVLWQRWRNNVKGIDHTDPPHQKIEADMLEE